MDAKRMIYIVSFLNYIQEKNCGKAESPRNAEAVAVFKFDGVRNFALWPGSVTEVDGRTYPLSGHGQD